MDRLTATRLIHWIRLEQPAPEHLLSGEWNAVIDAAERAGVLGLVASRVLALAEELPEDLRSDLRRRLRSFARHHGYYFIEAERVTTALAKLSIPSVVLKGVGLARSVYQDPAQRTFRDLDLLVPEDALEGAVGCVEALGYRMLTSGPLREVYRRLHFHHIFEGHAKPRLELHWGLTRVGESCRLPAKGLLERAVPAQGGGTFLVPAPEDQLMHATLNLLRGGFTELKRLVDIDRLLRSHSELVSQALATQASRAGLARALRLALELGATLLNSPANVALDRIPPLPGRCQQRLSCLRPERFPLRMPPSTWPFAPRWLRAQLGKRPLVELLSYVRRMPFERARLRALGASRSGQLLATSKRAALVALLLLRITGLKLSDHHFTPLLDEVDPRPNS